MSSSPDPAHEASLFLDGVEAPPHIEASLEEELGASTSSVGLIQWGLSYLRPYPEQHLSPIGCHTESTTDDGWAPFGAGPIDGSDWAGIRRLGLSPVDYVTFLAFVGSPFAYSFASKPKQWRSAREQCALKHSALSRHLRGSWWVATGCRKGLTREGRTRHRTLWFAIDLDRRDQTEAGAADLRKRYDSVVAAFGLPSVLLNSSTSGGLHAYYVLDRVVDLNRLISPNGMGAVDRILAGAGVSVAAGGVELYPTPKLANRPRGNRLRVPFGNGSKMVHPETLDVAHGSSTDHLRALADSVVRRQLRTLSFDVLFEDAKRRGEERMREARKRPETARRPTIAARPASAPSWTAEELLARGLPAPKAFDSSIRVLARHYWAGLYAEDRARELIVSWLHAGHNSNSATYNQDPEVAVAEIVDKVGRCYKQWGQPLLAAVPLPRVTAAEVVTMVGIARRFTAVEGVRAYLVGRILFDAVRHHKQAIVRLGEMALRRALRVDPTLAGKPAEFAAAIHAEGKAAFPIRPGVFEVPFPWAKRRRIRGLAGPSGSKYWKALKSSGFYALTQAASKTKRRCELYEVALDFSHGHAFESFDDGVCALFDHAERSECFGRSRARKLAAYLAEGAQPQPESGFVSLCRSLLVPPAA